MSEIKYKRNLPDGSQEIFEDIIKKPSKEQRYFDDMILNNASEESLPLKFYYFGKEQSYPLRTIRHAPRDRFLLHYVTEGSGTFQGKTIKRGQGFVVFPGTENTMSADNDDPWHFCWIIFGGREAYGLLKSVGIDEKNSIFQFGFFDRITEIFDDMIYRTHHDADMDLYMYAKFYELLSYHKKQYRDRISVGGTKREYVIRAMRYIDENYASDIKIEDIAAELHISRKYLCRIFTEYIGISTKEYFIQRRLEEASKLLRETGLSVSEIAHSVGYGDYTQLTRIFKEKRGCTPQQFRKDYTDSILKK